MLRLFAISGAFFFLVGVIDIREGFPKFMRVSPEGLALFLVEFVRVIREGCS